MIQQKDHFDLDPHHIYLNGAYMSPQLKSVARIGIENLNRKNRPYEISESDFFSEKTVLKKRFAQLINAPDPEAIAIIPSVSYGIANVIRNITFEKGDEIVLLQEQFPSNYYAWKQLETSHNVTVRIVTAPAVETGRAERWNEALLQAVTENTKVVAVPHVHWADGTLFDLALLRKRTNEVNAYLIVDGTQSVGALPFSVEDIAPDALICGGYKWLLGAYGLGVAYFGERFYQGTPIENNWMNHEGSENFANLVNYNERFKAKATRFDVGESSQFILVPMLSEGIRQLLQWTPEAIQEYCRNITKDVLKTLPKKHFYIEDPKYRAQHLFGIYPKNDFSIPKLKEHMAAQNISVSYRGQSIRVSPNVYNTEDDIKRLTTCLLDAIS
ncbi:aminotransferase class V-fold PLP-dependent enzyme [Altibacter sp.]|uniref:aminotransferase class V-fold PLP-dependent enzyme n=1 Tax=Altibacter sp. TaxID=2024823 RepID=UPI000C8B007A|nr:aminotransferase class V-fold PLP-dependent enzyme [Altibacter sp.]MAP55810.1 aminotransferase [Altibacter sp.]